MEQAALKEIERGEERACQKRQETGQRARALARLKSRRKSRQLIMGGLFLFLLGLGWLLPLVGYFIPLCMAAGVGLASIKGRKWCDWYCPRGSFADAYLSLLNPGRPIPRLLRGLPVRIGVLAFLMAMLALQITRLWPDYMRIGGFFMLLLTITTAIGVVLAALTHQRAWCSVCPIGTISHWVGRNRMPLVLSQEACVKCGLCAAACPMGLKPHERVKGIFEARGDCLKCGLCAATCPKGALRFDMR